jgi:hypothetical protein
MTMNIEKDPQQIKNQPPGSAIFVPINAGEDGMKNFCWVIRMESSEIKELKNLPEGSIKILPRVGFYRNEFDGKDVGLLYVMVGISTEGDSNEYTIYEAFCNEFANKIGGAAATLTTQQVMPFYLYGDSKEMEHSFAAVIPPINKTIAQKAIAHISRLDYEWTEEEFEICKLDFIKCYPSKTERWKLFEGEQ